MKKNHFAKKALVLLLAALMLVTMLPVNTFAAKKRKLIKTMKEYNPQNTLVYSQNSKGALKTIKWTSNYDGEKNSGTVTYKNTYWSKTSKKLKKTVITSKSEGRITTLNYNKKGLETKMTIKENGKTTSITTYKNNGKYVTSSVTKNADKKIISKSTFDKYGNYKTLTEYDPDTGKVAYKATCTNTYKKGVLKKQVEKSTGYNDGVSYSSTWTATFDKKGYVTSQVYESSDYKDTTTYKNTYNKAGYLTKVTASDGSVTKYTYTKKAY